MKKKPLFAVHFNGMMQPVKAVDADEAKRKFFKRFPKLTEEDILEVDEIEPDNKHFRIFQNSAI